MINSEKQIEKEGKSEVWQRRLLPFMIGSIIFMGIFFFIASLVQLYTLNKQVTHADFDLKPEFSSFEAKEETKPFITNSDYLKWKTLSLLEQDVIKRRYHQANSVMLARVWTRYMGFVTGMILALVGAVFILGKLREEPIQFEADSKVFKTTLYTTSPGILLAVLGTILMVTTIVIKFEISTTDVATYTRIKEIVPQSNVVKSDPPSLPSTKKTVDDEEEKLFGTVKKTPEPSKETKHKD